MAEQGKFGPPGGLSSSKGEGDRRNRISFYMDDRSWSAYNDSGRFTVTPTLDDRPYSFGKDTSVSFGYQGKFGYGEGTLDQQKGLNYNFSPAFDPNLSISGINFDTPSFSYNVPTRDNRVGASLNLQGYQGNFNPSLSANYSTGNSTVSGNVSPTGYDVQAYANNLFGIPGMSFQGSYGDSGGRGMIGYGSDR